MTATDLRPGPGPSLEGRATISLAVLALWAGVVILLVGLQRNAETTEDAVAAWLPILVPIGAGIAAFAVQARSRWAIALLGPLFLVVVAADVVAFVVGLGERRLNIPLGILLAIWTFRAPPESRMPAAASPKSLVVLALVGIGLFSQPLTGLAFTPGGPLVAGQDDLDGALTIDCGPDGAGIPDEVALTYRWTWRRTPALAESYDQVTIAWTNASPSNIDLTRFDLAEASQPDPWVDPGVSGSPNDEIAAQLMDRYQTRWDWTIRMPERGYQGGEIRLVLDRSTDPIASGALAARAVYIHHGRWGSETSSVECSWS